MNSKLDIKIISYREITKELKELFIDTYHNLYENIYGYDISTAYKIITKEDIESFNEKISYNSYLAKKTFESLKLKNICLIEIYNNNKIIGFSRVQIMNNKEIKVLDIAFVNLKYKKDFLRDLILVMERFFATKKYQKKYIVVNAKDVSTLLVLDDLGYKEDPKYITNNYDTYILSKKIESI